jgi:hypothetical protein
VRPRNSIQSLALGRAFFGTRATLDNRRPSVSHFTAPFNTVPFNTVPFNTVPFNTVPFNPQVCL